MATTMARENRKSNYTARNGDQSAGRKPTDIRASKRSRSKKKYKRRKGCCGCCSIS
uniref:Diacylglycerol kinase, putative n=1 Tax=Brugia malayi TaxID=6279 RepID=A0A912H3A5_BRUMA